MAIAPDLATFQEECFDPKSWINDACNSKPSEDSMERFECIYSTISVNVQSSALKLHIKIVDAVCSEKA